MRGTQTPHYVYHPKAEEIPSGLCECGCGEQTEIATFTNRKARYFRGYHRPFIAGHGRRAQVRKRGPESALFTGRRKAPGGYVYVYLPDHPNASKSQSSLGYILEHRVVWEEANGRLLTPAECVHHINGIRDDNRPENLVAMTRGEHRKLHRPDDKITDATRRKLSESTNAMWSDGRLSHRQ
jgi:hypothetical protein